MVSRRRMRTGVALAYAALTVLVLAVVVGVLLPGPTEPPGAEPDRSAVPVAPSQTSVAPVEQPGPPTVRFSQAAAEHPAAGGIRALLQTYFDAINLGDYRRWTTTVLDERARATSERAWRERYADRTYGSIRVQRVAARLGGGLVVLLSFTTVQDGDQSRCLRWRAAYPVVTAEFGQLRLARSDPGDTVRRPCSSVG